MAAGDPGSPKRYYSSIAVETTLSASISSAAQGDSGTIIVGSVSGFPSTIPYTLILDPDTTREEIVTVTATSGTTLTVTRGQDNTQAVAHAAGISVRHGVSGRDFREAANHNVARGYDSDSTILTAAGLTHVHGIASGDGDIVGTAKTQTMTNKTLTSPTINTPTITGGTITGLSSAGMVASSATPKDYVDNILGSATAAATSAASAATSASSALTSATSAATSASSASVSQSAAATSAASAAVSQSAAATSAASAAASASAASTSASSSASSQVAAASSEAAAAGSAAAAALSAGAITTYSTLPTEYRQSNAAGSVLNNTPTRLDAAEQLLKQAVFWIDANHSSASGQTITNLGWGGSALNATAGSTGSADSNDPKYLGWDGTNYVYLPGVTGNYLSVPDADNLDITGDIDIRVQVALDDWTPGTRNTLVIKAGATNTSYRLDSDTTTGNLRFVWTADGTTANVATSSVAPSVSDGGVLWVRVTLDVDNGASGRDVKFWTSADGVSWAQLGSTVTQANTTSIYVGTDTLKIGTNGATTGENLSGKVFRAQVLNGINGTPVLDVDTSLVTSGSNTSFTALTGQTVTINRSTSGRKSVAVTTPCYLFGTDDYMEVNNRWIDGTAKSVYLPGVAGNYLSAPDSAALDVTGDIDIRVKVALDSFASQTIIAKWVNSGNQRSYQFVTNSTGVPTFTWTTDGITSISSVATAALTGNPQTPIWLRATLDVDNGASGNDAKFFTSTDGATWTQLGSTVTKAGTTSIFNSSAGVEVGSYAGGLLGASAGKFYRAVIYSDLTGTTKVFDANMESSITSVSQTTFTESSTNAATVTINKSGTGYVSTPIVQSGYIYPTGTSNLTPAVSSLLDFGATDDFTVIGVIRPWTTSTNYGAYISRGNGDSPYNGWTIGSNGTNVTPRSTLQNVAATAPTVTAGSTTVFAMRNDRTAQTETMYANGTAGTPTSISSAGSPSTLYPLRIGRYSYGSFAGYQDFEFIAAAVFRRVLTAAEITTLNNYFQGRAA